MNPTLKKTLSGVFLGCSLLFAQISVAAAGDQPMNVLMIAMDDFKAIGTLFQDEKNDFLAMVYPDPELRRKVAGRITPNLQRLADQGVNFTSAYTPSPASNPARAALMTGIRPHVSGLASMSDDVFFRDWEFQGERPLADAVTLPELLKKHDWYTASTGKVYHRENVDAQDGNRSWFHWAQVDGRPEGPKVLAELSPQNFETIAVQVLWGQIGHDQETYHKMNNYRTADFIARVLENGEATTDGVTYNLPENTPFFLSLGIFRPYLPFITTKDLIDLFPIEEMSVTLELLEYFIQDEDAHPKVWKDMLRHYFAAAALADRSVGRVLDALESSAYKDNTMVILWSDHGFHLGGRMHVAKFTLWNEGSRVPFIIKDPRFPQSGGMRSHTPVSLMDIYPTVAAVAGVVLPDPRITGTDLTPLLLDPTLGREQPALVTYNHTGDTFDHMLQKGRYKLFYMPRGEQTYLELYDVAKDPREYRNLAVLPEYNEIRAMMIELLYETLESGYGTP